MIQTIIFILFLTTYKLIEFCFLTIFIIRIYLYINQKDMNIVRKSIASLFTKSIFKICETKV